MSPEDIKYLSTKPLALLRLTPDERRAITETRRQGARFSLNFPHEEAREGQRSDLVLIATPEPELMLRIGVIGSIGATATFESRVVFDSVSPIAPRSLDRLLASVDAPGLRAPRNRLASGGPRFARISDKLGRAIVALIAAEPVNGPALARMLAHMRRPTRFENARALQRDAVALAVKAFGGPDEAAAVALPSLDTAIGTVRVLEDAVIEHDAHWISGWRLADSSITGRATFVKRGEQLDVFTANTRPLEKLFGVDLIYLNAARGALVMVQYKMLEPGERDRRQGEAGTFENDEFDKKEWIVRIDEQFQDELARMRQFDRDLDPNGPYRLNSGAFFFKWRVRIIVVMCVALLQVAGLRDLPLTAPVSI